MTTIRIELESNTPTMNMFVGYAENGDRTFRMNESADVTIMYLPSTPEVE